MYSFMRGRNSLPIKAKGKAPIFFAAWVSLYSGGFYRHPQAQIKQSTTELLKYTEKGSIVIHDNQYICDIA